MVHSYSSDMAAASFNDVRQILTRWDKGSKTVRESMLVDFFTQCEDMTAPELERQFCDCASLFLARLTSWLRLTYMVGTSLRLQLRAIGVFVNACSGQHFLAEFLEVGGMLTVLEVVGLRGGRDPDKKEALTLLTSIANKGRQYKELLCESYGVKVIAECLALSGSEQTQECARNLLHQLSIGNPRYQSQVYKALIALLSSASSEAQRMAAFTLRQMQPSVGMASVSIVEPSLQLLRSLHVDVQHEACLLLQDLMGYEEVREAIMVGLIGLLKGHEDTSTPKAISNSLVATKGPLSAHLQQAGAAKVISTIISDKSDVAEHLIELRAVPHLLYAMGNTSHQDSQRQAALTLSVFVNRFAAVKDQVLSVMGEEFFEQFMKSPGHLYLTLAPSQIDVLNACLGHDTEGTE